MNDSTIFLILALCGLGVVVLGLIVFVFSLLFRFTGRNFISFLALLLQNQRENSDEKTFIQRPRRNLRTVADSQDFDAALAKHVVQDEGVVTNTELRAQSSAPPAPAGFEDVSSQIASRRRRIDEIRRKGRSDEDEELFGSMLDDGE
jgi:hypothetical protein